jgi:hypothetical protein
MAKFISGGDAVSHEVQKIVENAQLQLLLISPYIKLHHRLIASLKSKQSDPSFELVVVFGKNEHDKTKSIGEADLEFFKSFANVKISYEKHLHAKYYANEATSILCSMNLYDYSQNNNIEAGILMQSSSLKSLANNLVYNVTGAETLDMESTEFFLKVASRAELVYHNEAQFESQFLGLSKKYTESKVQVNKLEDLFGQKKAVAERKDLEQRMGYCIRTGVKIPFNINLPLSADAFESWTRYKNKDFTEKYCHFSGELSNNQTSFSKPILTKNWAQAKEIHKF